MKRLLFILIIFFLNGCATTTKMAINKSFDPIPLDISVKVYSENEKLPLGIDKQEIGTIRIGDSGLSINCSYKKVIEKAKNKARKAGGNCIKLTEVLEPDWTSTCYRIKAIIYRINARTIERINKNISISITTIAVLDFDGKNVSRMDATIVSDFIRSALIKKRLYQVVDRNNMEKILSEQGFQMTGCTTEDCAVRVGHILNIKHVIIGNLSKLGNVYFVQGDIVDVESGEIINSQTVKSYSVDQLDVAAKELIEMLFSM